MSEKEKPFTVNDRRHFTADGRSREEPAERQPEAPAQPDAPAAEPDPPAAEPRDAQARTARPGASGGGPVDLGQFVLSLGAQAGMLLGAEPGSEEAAESLEGARQIISILEMLHDKTQGRRTDQESRILEDLLFQLRMAFVERAKQG